jgi:hypothetical protein
LDTAVGVKALSRNISGSNNTAVGNGALISNTTGDFNSAIGAGANVSVGNLTNATAIGAGAVVNTSNQVQIGRHGTDSVRIGAIFGGGVLSICEADNILSTCGSSLRYKENVQSFRSGLTLLQRLRPVTFDWKRSKERDLGLIAEEVAEVDPLLITYNHTGEIEGVKYPQLTVVLINAIKEQQTQLERQQEQIDRQRAENAELKARLEALEQWVKERPYVTASAESAQ